MASRKVLVVSAASVCLLLLAVVWLRKDPAPAARPERPISAPQMDGDAYVIAAPWSLSPDLQQLRVPKAYLWLGGSEFEGGRGKRVTVEYELPSRGPVQKARPPGWVPEEGYLGRFSANVVHGAASGTILQLMLRVNGWQEGNFPHPPDPNIVRDGTPFGLERYSTLTCFDERELAITDAEQLRARPTIAYNQEQFRLAKESGPADHPATSPYCFVNRSSAEYRTPEGTPADEEVHITCYPSDCKMHLTISGKWGARVSIGPNSIAQWKRIAQGTRELALSFRK